MVLKNSWSNISAAQAKTYLHYYPDDLKIAMGRYMTKSNNPSILDLGCGNAQLYSIWKGQNFNFRYTGVDWSSPLLECARNIVGEGGTIVDANLDEYMETCKHFDCVVLCHMVELLESPDYTLHLAKKCSSLIGILWYEPPVSSYDFCKLLPSAHLNKDAPYIRRTMSVDYWKHLLKKHGLNIIHNQSSGDKALLQILE